MPRRLLMVYRLVQAYLKAVFNNKSRLGHNIGHRVGWVERSETQQLIGVGFRSSNQPTGNSYGLTQGQNFNAFALKRLIH